MVKFPVMDKNGKEKEVLDLPDDMFIGPTKTGVVHQAVVKYHASLRQGNASTKVRSEISGGGKKPFRQKGTGRARAGSSRSPLWHGGGIIFGPHPRDFSYTLPKRIKRVALRESLHAKYQKKNLLCVDDFKDVFQKTKDFVKVLKTLSLKGKILAILDGSDPSIERVSRNIPYFTLMRSADVNAYDILKNNNVLVSKTAFKSLIDRIRK